MKETPSHKLNSRNNLVYEIDSHTPFTGNEIEHYDTGEILMRTAYKDGKLEGERILYYLSGQCNSKSHFNKGKLNGSYEIYYENGQLRNKTDKKKITNIVFMGMGEPLLNYDNVIKSINVLTDQKGLAFSKRKVTLSTSGVVPKILDFKEDSDVNLAVSFHAAFDEIRDILVPINKKWPIAKLLDALKEYSKKRMHKRITFEYIMLEGINDSIKDAKELVKLIKPFRAKINLIPFNPWPGSNYKASSPDQIKVFKKFILDEGKLVATVRLPRGDDVLAACGQLKSF